MVQTMIEVEVVVFITMVHSVHRLDSPMQLRTMVIPLSLFKMYK